ncbi:hypothetical protein GmHk_17G050149 [Glycine max]|nr:hypothetical protein GmHk_17G050149 [Glycine max]
MVSSTITKLYPSSPTRVSWARKKMTIMRIFTTTLTSAKGSFNRCSRTTIEGQGSVGGGGRGGNVNRVGGNGVGNSVSAISSVNIGGVRGGGGGGGTTVGFGGTILFVGDSHWWTTDVELSKYGPVKVVKFFNEKTSGKSKGYY